MWNLLANNNVGSYVMIIALVAVIVVFMVLNSRSAKKRQQEQQNLLDAIKPGNKVKTIGGICGVVVEVNPEDNSFVLETGTEASGKSYIKFDKQAVYQTDAVPEPKATAPVEETLETANNEDVPEETPEAAEPVETAQEETAQEETSTEETND